MAEVSMRKRFDALREEIAAEYQTSVHAYPWIVAFSAGKDSTLLLQLVIEALLLVPVDARTRPVHILFNDTLVESPVYMKHANETLARLSSYFASHAAGASMPCAVHRVTPEADQTFWVNLIGRGYASPSTFFRWCTDRLKIAPTQKFIRSAIKDMDRVMLLLGVREAESQRRKRSIRAQGFSAAKKAKHQIRGCFTYAPILDVTTEELWAFLLQRPPPWGGSHRNLITLYKNTTGECPIVTGEPQEAGAPACGGSGSMRFGCWTCTLVAKDKSMEAHVDAGQEWLEPLVQLRGHLRQIRSSAAHRMTTRRNGQPGKGAFTFAVREDILARLLAAQEEVGIALISPQEIETIKRIWAEDKAVMRRRTFSH